MIDKTICKREFEKAIEVSNGSRYEDIRRESLLKAIAFGLAWVATVLEDMRSSNGKV